jgi:uncharacterized protein (UPF0276 family)
MTPTAGLGFKPQHFSEAMASPAVGLWFEVHAENYMVEGIDRYRYMVSDCRSAARRSRTPTIWPR